MEYLLTGLLSLALNPLIWIIVVVVILLVNDSKKKKIAQQNVRYTNATEQDVNSGQVAQPVAPPPPKPKNPMTKWNWLLYIGSFLIVLAMIYFVDSVNDAAVAPTTIILTLIIYCAGLAIIKCIDYLRPVGKAFMYSGLCMIPLWLISLNAIHVPSEIVPLIVSIIFTTASLIAALVLKDKILGYVTFLSQIAFVWSFYPILFKTVDFASLAFFTFLAPMVASIIPLSCWLTKPKWLPVAFRHASMGIGLVLIPMTFISSLQLFLIPDIGQEAPYLRTICAVFFLVYCIANWVNAKKHGFFIAARFAAQALILSVLCDSLNFSILQSNIFEPTVDYAASLTCAIVWLITFLAQVVYSLYTPCKDEKEQHLERVVGILSIIGIFITPILCSGFDKIPYAIVWIVICIVTAVLGILHAMRYKNVMWSLATVASILIMPFIFGYNIAKPVWSAGAYTACFSVIGLIFIFGYYAMQRIQKRESDTVGMIAIGVTSIIIITSSIAAEFSGVGYLVVAGLLAVFASLSKIKWINEVAIYSTAMSLFSFAGNVYDLLVAKEPESATYTNYYQSAHYQLGVALSVVRAHIILLAFGLTCWLYERKKDGNHQARFIIGYIIFSLIMSVTCSINYSSLGWAILLLVEQVIALLFSVTTRRTWLVWCSSIEIFLIAFRLTGGFNFIWLGLIGIGLIAFVIWQLSKANRKNLAQKAFDEQGKPMEPIAPQASAETDRAETPQDVVPVEEIEESEESVAEEESAEEESAEEEPTSDEAPENSEEPKKEETPKGGEDHDKSTDSDDRLPEDVLWELDNHSIKHNPEDQESKDDD